MDEEYNGISRDVSTLAFHVLYQAITDAMGIGTLHRGGRTTDDSNKLHHQIILSEARAFIASDNLELLYGLAKIHYEVPTPSKIRERLARLIVTDEKMDVRELHRISFELHEPRKPDRDDCGDDLEGLPEMPRMMRGLKFGRDEGWKVSPTPSPKAAQEKESKDSKESKD